MKALGNAKSNGIEVTGYRQIWAFERISEIASFLNHVVVGW